MNIGIAENAHPIPSDDAIIKQAIASITLFAIKTPGSPVASSIAPLTAIAPTEVIMVQLMNPRAKLPFCSFAPTSRFASDANLASSRSPSPVTILSISISSPIRVPKERETITIMNLVTSALNITSGKTAPSGAFARAPSTPR